MPRQPILRSIRCVAPILVICSASLGITVPIDPNNLPCAPRDVAHDPGCNGHYVLERFDSGAYWDSHGDIIPRQTIDMCGANCPPCCLQDCPYDKFQHDSQSGTLVHTRSHSESILQRIEFEAGGSILAVRAGLENLTGYMSQITRQFSVTVNMNIAPCTWEMHRAVLSLRSESVAKVRHTYQWSWRVPAGVPADCGPSGLFPLNSCSLYSVLTLSDDWSGAVISSSVIDVQPCEEVTPCP